MLKVLFVLLSVVSYASCSSHVHYDVNNFQDIVGNSHFEVMPYNSLNPVYGVPVPTGGVSSGGAFLFDSSSYGCMIISLDKAPSLTIFMSFWCDPVESELQLATNCGYSAIRLCQERKGEWNVTQFVFHCESYLSNLEIQLCGNAIRYGTSVGYEYITAYSGDYTTTTSAPGTTVATIKPNTVTTTHTLVTTTTTTPDNCCACCCCDNCPPCK